MVPYLTAGIGIKIHGKTFHRQLFIKCSAFRKYVSLRRWRKDSYVVTFDGNGETIYRVKLPNGGVWQSGNRPVFTKEGYTLSWDKAFNNITSRTNSNRCLTIKTYAVTFDGNGGDYISGEVTQTVEYGKAATAPYLPKRATPYLGIRHLII